MPSIDIRKPDDKLIRKGDKIILYSLHDDNMLGITQFRFELATPNKRLCITKVADGCSFKEKVRRFRLVSAFILEQVVMPLSRHYARKLIEEKASLQAGSLLLTAQGIGRKKYLGLLGDYVFTPWQDVENAEIYQGSVKLSRLDPRSGRETTFVSMSTQQPNAVILPAVLNCLMGDEEAEDET